MATVIVARPRATVNSYGNERMWMKTGSLSFGVPLAPKEVTYDGFNLDWQPQTRPGRKPVLTNVAPVLKTMAFTLTLAYTDIDALVQPHIDRLSAICRSTLPIYIHYDANSASCGWRCTAMTVTTVERHSITNAPTRATVDLTFTEYTVAK